MISGHRPASLQGPIARIVLIVRHTKCALWSLRQQVASAVHHPKSFNVELFHHVSFAHRAPCRRVCADGNRVYRLPRVFQGEKYYEEVACYRFVVVPEHRMRTGWLPCLFRGANCGNGSCIGAAPALPHGCTTCVDGSAAGYGSYDGEVVGDGYYGSGTVVGENYLGSSVVPTTVRRPLHHRCKLCLAQPQLPKSR